MKAKMLFAVLLLVPLLFFVFNTMIAEEIWLEFYWNNPTDSDQITHEGEETDNLYWWVKNSLIGSGEEWSTYVELEIWQTGGTPIVHEYIIATSFDYPEEDWDIVEDIGDLSGYNVAISGGDVLTSGMGTAQIVYPST